MREQVLDRLDPYVAEIRSATWDGDRGFTWAEGARRFETWENSYVNILGLAAAVRQALDLGLDRIGERTSMLGDRLRTGLDGLSQVSTHDLGRERCAIVTAKVDGVAVDDVASALAGRGISRNNGARAQPVRHRGPRRAPFGLGSRRTTSTPRTRSTAPSTRSPGCRRQPLTRLIETAAAAWAGCRAPGRDRPAG